MNWVSKIVASGAALLVMAGGSLAAPAGNKAKAVAAMTEMFNTQNPAVVDRYFTSPYRQHNLYIPDGIDALKAMVSVIPKWKGVHTDIRRAIEDGDIVVLHSAYRNLLALDRTNVAFDMFRFKDGKIVEHWDALQPVMAGDAAVPAEIAGPTEVADLDKTAANRTLVRRYVETVLIGGKSDQAKAFIDAKDYADHRPQVRSVFDAGKPDLSTPVKQTAPVQYLKVHRVIADGNFVFVQSEGKADGFPVLKVYDLFRAKNGKLVEHWDVRQPVAPRAQWSNPNGPF